MGASFGLGGMGIDIHQHTVILISVREGPDERLRVSSPEDLLEATPSRPILGLE